MNATPSVMEETGSSWSRDRWSGVYLTLCILAALLPVPFMRSQSAVWLLLVLLTPVIFVAGGFPFLFGVTNRRPKLAVSAVAGMALIASDFWTLPVINRSLDLLSFHMNKASYDRLVETERSKLTSAEPLRIVVEYEDHSVFVTANLFAYVIYDETDEAGKRPDTLTGYWPCPSSTTGIISMDGNETGGRIVWHITGHYYRYFVE